MSQVSHSRKWQSVGVLIAALTITIGAVLLPSPAPAVTLEQAQIFRNVLTDSGDGDLLVLARGELPLSGWCSELEDTTGCPTDPDNPTSLANGKAFLRLLKSCTGPNPSDCSVVGETPIRRISHMMEGVYLDVGHGVTWGDATARVCIIAPATAFDDEQSSCSNPDWRPTSASTSITTRPDAVAQLTSDIVSLMKNLEFARLDVEGDLVSGEKITPAGALLAEEAFSLIQTAAPQAFTAGSIPTDLFATPFAVTTPSAEDFFATQQAGSTFFTAADELAENYVGVPFKTFGQWLTVILSLTALIGVSAATQKPMAAMLSAEIPWVAGVWFFIPFSWIGVGMVLGVVAISALIASKLPE